MAFDFVTNDTGSVLNVTCTDKVTKAALDLTGASIELHWRNAANARITRTMTIVSAIAGTVKYQFLTGEIFAPTMVFEVQITDTTGKTLTNTDTFSVSVREEIL